MTPISKSLILSVACASILAACAENPRTQTTKAGSTTAQKAEAPKDVVPTAKFMKIAPIEAEVEVREKTANETVFGGFDTPKKTRLQPTGLITLADPEDATKAVILATDKKSFTRLNERVTMTAKNQSQNIKFKAFAQCYEVRGDYCDAVLAVIVQEDATGKTKKDVMYFQRTIPEGAKLEELVKTAEFNNKDLDLAHAELDRTDHEETLFQRARLDIFSVRGGVKK